MYFTHGNVYLLSDVTSKFDNPLHQEIVGHLCELEFFEPAKFGRFLVELDDGQHHIHTTIVQRVDITAAEHNVVVHTTNSVYTFTPVYETEHIAHLELARCSTKGVSNEEEEEE